MPSKSPFHGLESTTAGGDAVWAVLPAVCAVDVDASAIAPTTTSMAGLRETSDLGILDPPPRRRGVVHRGHVVSADSFHPRNPRNVLLLPTRATARVADARHRMWSRLLLHLHALLLAA